MKVSTLPRNPFATRHTRPGKVPPLDAAGKPIDIRQVVAAVHAHGGASIEGPHGTGKSTLLAAIARTLDIEGTFGGLLRLRHARDTAAAIRTIVRAQRQSYVCLDGWEVLGPCSAVVRWVAWWRGVGLVVTTHHDAGFAHAIRTTATWPLLEGIVDFLTDGVGLVDDADVARAYERHPGNVREALLDLYDRFEHRARMRA